MKFNKGFWIATAVLVVWLILSWFLGSWMGIKSPGLWYLRAGLAVLGIAGFVGYLVLRPKGDSAPVDAAAADAATQIDYNFNEASKRIQAATGNKQLNSLPAVFLLGDTGAAKTSIITQSGIEPELVAGQALQAGQVVPTASVNLWYARNTLFIDPAGGVVADAGARRKLFKKFLPVQLNSLLASKAPPTRSVLLTVDCETFLGAGGANAVSAKARDYQAVLGELSRELGSSFPVYVLFTKADRIPYFREFVENLSEAEIAELLGLSLPIPPVGFQGSYAEKQSQRLDNAFQTLYYALADRRPSYLGREHTATNLSNIYEFPREFAKLRTLVVQFLTELCRPSQLSASPFLRGFYFSGIRPVVINDVTPASQVQMEEDGGFDAGATRMFNRPSRSAPIAEAKQAGSRRVPQWVFLRSLFSGVLLADRVGTAAAQVNVKVNFVRRVLLASAAALALLMALLWTISYRNNSRLVDGSVEDAKLLASATVNQGMATTEALTRLSKVRATLSQLKAWDERKPLGYGLFLYQGQKLESPLRATYYTQFRRLLLAPTQQTLIQITRNPGDDKAYSRYQYVYNALKAYLITTNNHDKNWNDFVGVLVQHWKKDQPVDNERESQATSNFAFYADELPDMNPYPQFAVPDRDAVDAARLFLNSFPLEDSIYRAMLDSAGDKLKSIVFNRDYPGTADTVINKFPVEPWFTRDAYIKFQNRLKDNGSLGREEWVLGPATQQNVDMARIRADLKVRYDSDYVKTWRQFLVETSEAVPYSNYARAASVLEKLGGPQSALMQLFCVASVNTAVPTKEVAQAFQPVQFVAPAGCTTQLVGGAATPYVGALGALSNALKAIGPVDKPNEAMAANAGTAVSSAQNSETSLALGFQSDPTDPKGTLLTKATHLLKDPIDEVPPILGGLAGGELNGKAGGTCAVISPVFKKYPFNSASKEDATLAEVNDALNPQSGKLWAFVNSALAPYVQKAGSQYVAMVGLPLKITPAYLNFLNRAALMTQAFYGGGGSATPNMNFVMQALPAQDVDHVSLAIDGGTLAGDPKDRPSQTFIWPGSAPGVSLQVRLGTGPDLTVAQNPGLWAVWHFLDTAEKGSWPNPEWIARSNAGPFMVKGHPVAVKFNVDASSAQVLRPQFLAGMGCPSKAVQ